MAFLPACSSSRPKLKDPFPRVLKGNTIFPKCLSQTLMNIQITYFNKMSKHSFEGNYHVCLFPLLPLFTSLPESHLTTASYTILANLSQQFQRFQEALYLLQDMLLYFTAPPILTFPMMKPQPQPRPLCSGLLQCALTLPELPTAEAGVKKTQLFCTLHMETPASALKSQSHPAQNSHNFQSYLHFIHASS